MPGAMTTRILRRIVALIRGRGDAVDARKPRARRDRNRATHCGNARRALVRAGGLTRLPRLRLDAACFMTTIAKEPASKIATGPEWLSLMPGLFVVLWSTGFIGANYGPPYADPPPFLPLRFFLFPPTF